MYTAWFLFVFNEKGGYDGSFILSSFPIYANLFLKMKEKPGLSEKRSYRNSNKSINSAESTDHPISLKDITECYILKITEGSLFKKVSCAFFVFMFFREKS